MRFVDGYCPYNCPRYVDSHVQTGATSQLLIYHPVQSSILVSKMGMDKITFEKAKQIAINKGLKPGKVKGTNGIQFTKGKNNRLEIITWEEFEAKLKERKLAVYESGGWMKIMKA